MLLSPIKTFSDERGKVKFANGFDLSKFVRFYIVENQSPNVIRAWQGHKIEEKAFFPISGKTKIVLVPILNFDKGVGGKPLEFVLDADQPQILEVPPGYANGIQGMVGDDSVMVFSTLNLEAAKNDDYRFDKSLWYEWNTSTFKS